MDKSLCDVPLLPAYAAVQRFQSIKGEGNRTKRKCRDIELPTPSKKLSLKIRKLNTIRVPGFEKQIVTSSDEHDFQTEKPKGGTAVESECSAGPEARLDWDVHFESIDNLSDTDDDGYFPPHWMVDANLAKSVPD